MQFDKAKLNALIMYACSKTDPACLGLVKMHKILYFSDMLFYAQEGRPITGGTYRKRPYGPMCEELSHALSELKERGYLEIKEVDYFGYQKKEFIPLESVPDITRLNTTEILLVDEIIEFVCNSNTAKTISDFSHNKAWDAVRFGDVIPYNSVYAIFPTEVSQEAIDWGTLEARHIADAGFEKASVARYDFGDFRSRVLQTRGL